MIKILYFIIIWSGGSAFTCLFYLTFLHPKVLKPFHYKYGVFWPFWLMVFLKEALALHLGQTKNPR